jgi:hypothetical protein
MTLDQSVIYRRNDAGHFQQTGQGNKIAIFLIRGDVYRFVEGAIAVPRISGSLGR